MILQQPLERGPQGGAQRLPRAALGVTRGLDAREPLRKQFLSEENMATHFSQLSLHNDHPYCSPPMAFPQALPPLRRDQRLLQRDKVPPSPADQASGHQDLPSTEDTEPNGALGWEGWEHGKGGIPPPRRTE
ncbi:host cell factor C1 regulator 1 isoform X3 [Macaca thibetana thibetana]|uniref:host cell factor C1 regulator 1 isoform X3 n=1 Tax=Macaca thibetana thibetana TaxID=257877 RepID=UPI0021BCA845|nr:host cell factor C1 regulator 1 isoform X3 [Macaca thibetana thibetana]